MIEVRNLSFKYKQGGPLILNDLSFKLGASSVLAILGRNGIGKTTFIRCLTAEVHNYLGSITVSDREVRELSVSELSSVIAVVASNNPCYQNLRVADFLVTGFANKLTSLQSPNKNQYEKAYSILEDMGHGKLFNRDIFELSSGEMQIVKIARAIIQNPKIIVFDEPTSNLDIKNQLIVLNQITRLAERGYCVITTTHNPGQAMELNDMVLMMSDEGQQFGKATDIITEENLKRTYDLEATIEQGRYRRYASFGDTENLHRLVY